MYHVFNTAKAFNLTKDTMAATEGDTCFISDEKKNMIYKNNQWEDVDKPKSNLKLSLYDLNKTAIGSMPPRTPEQLEKDKKIITDYFDAKNNKYFMMLNHELRYFTVLHRVPVKDADDVIENLVIELAFSVGDKIISINLDDAEQALEVWITKSGEVFCLVIFPYDLGVVDCEDNI